MFNSREENRADWRRHEKRPGTTGSVSGRFNVAFSSLFLWNIISWKSKVCARPREKQSSWIGEMISLHSKHDSLRCKSVWGMVWGEAEDSTLGEIERPDIYESSLWAEYIWRQQRFHLNLFVVSKSNSVIHHPIKRYTDQCCRYECQRRLFRIWANLPFRVGKEKENVKKSPFSIESRCDIFPRDKKYIQRQILGREREREK